jgi:hypothetical protein
MRWLLASIVLVISSVLLQWYGHSGGLLTTSDSCNYLSAASSFKSNFTFLSYDGEPYLYWPPLFPIILSVLGGAWYWIHLSITAWIGVLVVIETRKVITDPLLQLICQASILLSVHLLMIGVFLWSELLFLLLLIYFIKAVEKNFVAAIILGFFLCLQRNSGIFFVIGAALWYWDLKKSIILFALATSGFWAWNIYVSVAQEYHYFQSIIYNFNVMSTAMMNVLAPVPGFFILIIAGAVGFFLKDDIKTRLMSVMIITYMACLVVIFPIAPSDSDRFVTVIIPFFMILVFRAIEIVLAKQTSARRIVLMIVVVCWLAYPLSRALKNASQWHKVSFTSYFCGTQ